VAVLAIHLSGVVHGGGPDGRYITTEEIGGMSGLGRQAARVAQAGGDAGIRRRIDIARLFFQRPSERLTVHEVADHTVGTVEEVRALLDELVDVGWLRRGRDEHDRVAYWREVAGG
jgi:hypothetical protein